MTESLLGIILFVSLWNKIVIIQGAELLQHKLGSLHTYPAVNSKDLMLLWQ